MAASLRALLSVVMLLGFYLVAFVMLLFSTGLFLVLLGAAPFFVFVTLPLFVAIFGGAGKSLWRAARLRHEIPPGIVLTPLEAPALWAEVNRLAQAADTRPPDELRLVAAVNAAVSQHSRLFGLVRGRRYLYVGLPLLQALNAGQLRAVLAHELGHFSGAHTRFGAVAYRGRLAVSGTVSSISRRNVVGWAFRGYARLYLLVDNVVARRQERQADAVAARVAGKRAAISALTDVQVVDAAFANYMHSHVATGSELGLMPDDIFGGFSRTLAEHTELLDYFRDELAEPAKASRWDTHPPLSQRIAAIESLPADTLQPDPAPAAAWLSDINGLGRRLQREAVATEGRTVLPWPDFSSAVMTAHLQQRADAIFREIGRVLGRRHVDLPTVLDQVEANAVGPMAAPFYPTSTRRESAARFHSTLRVLLMLAAVQSGAARWRHTWGEESCLIDASGQPLNLSEVAKLAADPQTLPAGKARLAQLGIDFYSARVVDQVVSARGAKLLGALANILIDGKDTDVFILDTGLVLAPATGGKMDGDSRVERMAAATPPEKLALRFDHLPYEEIRSIRLEEGRLFKGVLRLRDERVLTLRELWSSGQLGRHSRTAFYDMVKTINSR